MNEQYLGQTITAKIDRPFGSKHPKHGFIYPLNYGFIPGTVSGDGEELDCYVLGVFEPVEEDLDCVHDLLWSQSKSSPESASRLSIAPTTMMTNL